MSPSTTFADAWAYAVRDHHDRTFLVFADDSGTTTEWTYAEFDDIVCRVTDTLRHHGVESGGAVHLALGNCPGFIAAWLACARIGAWMVPADPRASAGDISGQVRRTQPRLGMCATARADVYHEGVAGTGLPVIEIGELAGDLVSGPLLTARSGQDNAPGGRPAPTDRMAVMFTSGTTSQPKGVVLTQQNYATVSAVMQDAVGLTADSRWLVTLPLFHANAQYYCFAPAIAAGASVALTSKFSASQWLRQAAALGVTHASLFAAPIRMILARSTSDQPTLELEHVWFAQNLAKSHYEEFAGLVGCRPRQLYGMTETVAAVTGDTSSPLQHDVMGSPLGGRRTDVVDPETMESVPDGTPGLLLVHGARGDDLFLEYLDDPGTTDRSFLDRDGETWFITGDLVTRDESGAFRFSGRGDDMVKVSGENVSLAHVESVVSDAPGVLEVAVVARPDPVKDQVPVAYVVARDPENPPHTEELSSWAASRLAPACWPQSWHLVSELPKTSVGKIRRFALKAQ